jgi:hypothetical protein
MPHQRRHQKPIIQRCSFRFNRANLEFASQILLYIGNLFYRARSASLACFTSS